MKIHNAEIGLAHAPFVIAEMSGNHNQSLERAFRIIDAAVAAGAHAIKLQTGSQDGMTLNVDHPDFVIQDKNSLWHGRHLYELYGASFMPWEWHRPIFDYCREKGIIVFSSPFELKAVDFLNTLGVPCYKIASFELVDLQLVRHVAMTAKPVIISTGMATLSEIEAAIAAIRETGNEQIVLLKCTSAYPANPENSNLLTIPHLRSAFGTEVGLSDHTMGVGVSCAAVAMGATVIEKHFTLSRAEGGIDADFSLEPHELHLLVEETRRAWEAKGCVRYGGSSQNELASLKFRRSIYVAHDISAGDILTTENIRVIRPGYGLPPRFIDLLLGKHVNRSLKKGMPMSWEYLA
ncbi:MAG: pseudaminic acid synthase [Zoogloeaceae bacterium]|jgi:N-acetylneuraminate synthase|nr:pseudaminic acid synthase [Zoogloeaceae bacterium]